MKSLTHLSRALWQFVLLLCCLAASSPLFAQTNIVGNWQGTRTWVTPAVCARNEPMQVAFTQTSNALRGTILNFPAGHRELAVVISGNAITMTSMHSSFTGTISSDGTLITGQFSGPNCNSVLITGPFRIERTSTVIQNPFVDSRILSLSPNGNEGSITSLAVFNDGSSNVQRSLIFFDLGYLPRSTVIASAELRLVDRDLSFVSGGHPVYAFRTIRPWHETQVTWNRSLTGSLWSNAGGDFAGTTGVYNMAPYAAAFDDPINRTVTFDVTRLVKEWVSGKHPNYGFFLTAPAGHQLHFHSRESDAAVRPQLTLQFGPSTSSIRPNTAERGSSGFTLTVNGNNFVTGSTVRWNGAARPTTYISPTQLTAAIPASDLVTTGTFEVSVINPSGAVSLPQFFAVGTVRLVISTDSLPIRDSNTGEVVVSIRVQNLGTITARNVVLEAAQLNLSLTNLFSPSAVIGDLFVSNFAVGTARFPNGAATGLPGTRTNLRVRVRYAGGSVEQSIRVVIP